MRDFLAIDKALQSIEGELLNNTSKLTEIHKSSPSKDKGIPKNWLDRLADALKRLLSLPAKEVFFFSV